jgi:hypothetical protein
MVCEGEGGRLAGLRKGQSNLSPARRYLESALCLHSQRTMNSQEVGTLSSCSKGAHNVSCILVAKLVERIHVPRWFPLRAGFMFTEPPRPIYQDVSECERHVLWSLSSCNGSRIEFNLTKDFLA